MITIEESLELHKDRINAKNDNFNVKLILIL